jgi:hypothetical protein
MMKGKDMEEVFMAYLRYNSRIFLEVMRKTKKRQSEQTSSRLEFKHRTFKHSTSITGAASKI